MRRFPLQLTITTTALLVVALSGCGSSSARAVGHAAASTTTSTASAPSTTRPAGPTPLDLVQAEVTAFNRGDVAAAVALFTPDAVLITTLGGCDPCIGRDTIRDHWSRAIAAQSTIRIDAPHQSGAVVTASSSLRAPSFPDGVQRAIGTLQVTVVNDKFSRWEQTYDLSDAQTARLFAAVGLAPATTTSVP